MQTCDEDLLWYWIRERWDIMIRKNTGAPKPWSEDPIFQRYKFVNVFRQDDRTTRWLYENFIGPRRHEDPALVAFNICWFRMFNRVETGAYLGWQYGWNWQEKVGQLLDMMGPCFTGAYVIRSEPGRGKIQSIVDTCFGLYCVIDEEFIKRLGNDNSMEATWRELQQVQNVGGFMAYQMVLDMAYTPALLANAGDYRTWAYVGPGALRGLRRLYPGIRPRDCLAAMVDLAERSPGHVGAVPALSVHDVEFALCELDKYARVKFGEGRPRSTYPGEA